MIRRLNSLVDLHLFPFFPYNTPTLLLTFVPAAKVNNLCLGQTDALPC